jgi:hypothetical protein
MQKKISTGFYERAPEIGMGLKYFKSEVNLEGNFNPSVKHI